MPSLLVCDNAEPKRYGQPIIKRKYSDFSRMNLNSFLILGDRITAQWQKKLKNQMDHG